MKECATKMAEKWACFYKPTYLAPGSNNVQSRNTRDQQIKYKQKNTSRSPMRGGVPEVLCREYCPLPWIYFSSPIIRVSKCKPPTPSGWGCPPRPRCWPPTTASWSRWCQGTPPWIHSMTLRSTFPKWEGSSNPHPPTHPLSKTGPKPLTYSR